jgi:uncharacterized membrane protein YoaK (UPF0700 family)
MTGNVVLLGFGLAGAGGLPIVAPLVSLGGFILGAGAGGRIAVRVAEDPGRHFRLALVVETALLTCAAVVAAATTARVGSGAAYAVIVLLAVAMGVRNATGAKTRGP